MFLSRYLERLSGIPVVFGLENPGEARLRQELSGEWHPEVKSALRPGSPGPERIAKRFAQMLSRNRGDTGNGKPQLISDHGFHSFLRFLVKPSKAEIRPPEDIVAWAAQRDLAVVYLYRDIRAVANSLTHFLASGRSFLLDIGTLQQAAQLAAEIYAPVLAQQMREWGNLAGDQRVLSVAYEELVKEPAALVKEICDRGGIPFDEEDLIQTTEQYPSWTYRGSKGGSWRETFTAEQQDRLAAA